MVEMCLALPGQRQHSPYSATPSGYSWELQGPEQHPGAYFSVPSMAVAPYS